MLVTLELRERVNELSLASGQRGDGRNEENEETKRGEKITEDSGGVTGINCTGSELS